ncbi:MAG: hypothetical protein ABI421_08645 [Polyangiaceae bacterium]
MTDHAQLPEPKTPMWLPALGLALFLLVGVFWATRPAPYVPPPPAPVASAAATGSAAPAAPAPPTRH